MLTSLWQKVKNRVWDSVTSLFRTQEEIFATIDEDYQSWGYTVEYNPAELPTDGKYRQKEFWSPDDLHKYVSDAGIPPSCVFIIPFEEWDDEGNTMWKLYILEDTP